MAEKTDAQKRAQKAYMEKFVRVEIRMNAEQRATIQAYAEAHDQSVNSFINRAIEQTMEQDGVRIPPEIAQRAAGTVQGAGVVSLPSETMEVAQRAAEAAGEVIPQFIARAVETQAQRDNAARKMKK